MRPDSASPGPDAARDAPPDATPGAAALARVRVVLVATSHPGNVGASARAMLTMGLAQLVLVAPRRHPDPEADARASGATSVLRDARIVATLDDALRGATLTVGCSARPREFAGRVATAREAARLAIAHARRDDVAIVFGTEMSGLSNEELARCGVVATIPANPAYSSLNLAAAVQVLAYELRVAATGGDVWRAPRFPPAAHDEIEGLYAHAERTLADMRFLDPKLPRRLLPRLRRLFARAGLEREEVNILRGILARIDELLDGRRRS
ncbi:MAG: RNA methyltransferase [Burkholderiales bacterium]|nr:RNA methyltransferase [Burkholderiales bacterium]